MSDVASEGMSVLCQLQTQNKLRNKDPVHQGH